MLDFSSPSVYIPTIFIMIVVIYASILRKDSKKYTHENKKDLPYYDEINASIGYLSRNILEDGRFQYRNNINPDIIYDNKIYNSLRHAGTLYALYRFEKDELENKYYDLRIDSSKYFIKNYIKKLGKTKCIVVSKPEEEGIKITIAKSGAAGVALCALSNLVENNNIDIEILRGLGEFLLYMQNEEGNIYAYYDCVKKQINKTAEAIFYPAEAAMGLIELYKFDPQEKWLNGAKKIINYIVKTRKTMDLNIPFDHWSVMVIEELLKNKFIAEEETGEMRAYAEQMAIPVLSTQITNPKNSYYGAFKDNIRPCSLGTIMEGLASIYNCTKNKQMQSIIFKSLAIGNMFLNKVQVKTGVHAGGLPNSANWVKTGVTPNASVIRIDNIQHVVLGWIKFQKILVDSNKI